MKAFIDRLYQIHRFLQAHSLYGLLVASLLAIGLLAGRLYLTHSPRYLFLIWNLFLAWVPYLCALWIASIRYRKPDAVWRLLPPGGAWLLFFPNAPYLVTDFIHLRGDSPFPLWYDVVLLATFAWTGCFLAIISLHAMRGVVEASLGRLAGYLFVLMTIVLSGLGIYLGRFLRWNSWDVLFEPGRLLTDTLVILLDPYGQPHAAGVTILFSLFLLVCYLTVPATPLRQLNSSRGGE